MKRPKFKDYKPDEINCAEDIRDWYELYSKDMVKYADHLEQEIEQLKAEQVELVKYTLLHTHDESILSIESPESIVEQFKEQKK